MRLYRVYEEELSVTIFAHALVATWLSFVGDVVCFCVRAFSFLPFDGSFFASSPLLTVEACALSLGSLILALPTNVRWLPRSFRVCLAVPISPSF